MKSLISKIWKAIWAFLIPLIITVIISPFNEIFDYQGIIKKEPVLKEGYLIYGFSNNYPQKIENFNFTFEIRNKSFLVDRIRLTQQKYDKEFTTEFREVVYPNGGEVHQYMCDSLSKGVYFISIKLKYISKPTSVPAQVVGELTMFKSDLENVPIAIVKVRNYHFYDYRYFHPISTSIITLIVLLIATLSIKYFKK